MANGKKSSKTQNPSTHDNNEQSACGADEQDGGRGSDDCFVTKSYVIELLKIQESMFRSIFESMMENVTNRVDKLSATLESVKTSLEFTQNEVHDLKKAKDQTQKIEAELDQVHGQIKYHCDKLEYLENQSRRNNIRIDGIPESGGESWDETEDKAKQALESSLEPRLMLKLYELIAQRRGDNMVKPPRGPAPSYAVLPTGRRSKKF